MALSLLFSSCSSDEPVQHVNSTATSTLNEDGSETFFLPNGECITLQDTTTYHIEFNIDQTLDTEAFGAPMSRGIAPTGYDRESKPKDYKKYALSGLEKWGISPTNIYLGKFIDYYKDLPVTKGYMIVPTNSKYKTENKMGFNSPSYIQGYHTIVPDAWTGYESGVTQIFYVKCDISGISWNRNIPCDPIDLVWYYRTIEE